MHALIARAYSLESSVSPESGMNGGRPAVEKKVDFGYVIIILQLHFNG